MTTPVPQDALLARLGDDLAGVTREIDRIRAALQTVPTPQTLRTAPPPRPAPSAFGTPVPSGAWSPPAGWGPPRGPSRRGVPAIPPRPPRPPRAPRPARAAWTPARLLAITGAATTVLGVVMLLVLAANRGWFHPEARVAGGALLGLALVGVGVRVRRRTGDGSTPPAAVALAATGVSTLFLAVAAAVSLYAMIPLALAVPTALAVAAGGLLLADHWRHRGLALGVLLASALAAPLVVGAPTPTLVALLLGAQVAAVLVARRRAWPAVAALAAGASSLAALGAAIRMLADAPDSQAPTTVAVLAVLAAGAVSAVLVGAPGRPVAASLLGAPVLPVLLTALGLARLPGMLVAGGVAVALLVLVVTLDRLPAPAGRRGLAVVAGTGGTAALLVATVLAVGDGPGAAPLLAEAAVLAVAAAVTRRGGPLLAAAALGLVGGLAALVVDAPIDLVVDFPTAPFVVTTPGGTITAAVAGELVGALVTSLLLAGAAAAAIVALARLGALRDRVHAALAVGGLGVVGLYGATGTVIAGALLVSPTRGAFLVGHVLVTVSWTAVALVLLARGLQASLPRVLGGVLVVAAVAKLVLFDLTALDGLARVAAFLGAGLVLLAAGTRYARAVAGTSASDPATSAASSSRVGPSAYDGRQPEA
ncbi:hypothetical protein Acsp06_00670 [Actinomycetospora sp. NBRC 106375]|uniref:DUF2339 domain-containing protein n=1 Tax=Actinomycetospora sp. NBRC 106375 TaxID=3032207 RepID=UPI0024A42434|nr:DUF2339 domain-containing protein [Actinomycetospora sp. NBRC 106375]GLZ43882.1 hypothetical protein Acsp06_00670 [Actinomycetospora sp. NBRC 106375]